MKFFTVYPVSGDPIKIRAAIAETETVEGYIYFFPDSSCKDGSECAIVVQSNVVAVIAEPTIAAPAPLKRPKVR